MYNSIVSQSLFPRLENLCIGKNLIESKKLSDSFFEHCNFIGNHFNTNDGLKLTEVFFINLHKILYPVGFQISATGNDGVKHVMLPGEFRKQYLAKFITDFCSVGEIASSFDLLVQDYQLKEHKSRQDILKFFLDFGKIHPFGDSNGTVSALFCDVECVKYGFKPLNTLSIRFKNKEYGFQCLRQYEKNHNLDEILKMFDDFNDGI